jgi:signal transduction histidine kinase
LHPSDLAALVEQYRPRFCSAREGDVIDVEARLRAADGTWRWFHSRNVVFSWRADGRPRQVLSTALDITDRKRDEARLRELEKLAQQRERLADIGAITATLAHDLRNPLGNIALNAYLVEQATRDIAPPAPGLADATSRLLGEVRRLEHLISELMNISREQRLNLKMIDLPLFVQQALAPWQGWAEERQISLSLECAGGVPSLRADEEKLRRVVDNLIRNALEAIDQGPGNVRVHVTMVEAGLARISVEDTGPGIPETLNVFRIFETTKPNGSGLGLALARQIVLAHGGSVHYENLQPRGAVFHIDIPCSRPLDSAQPPVEESQVFPAEEPRNGYA